MISATQFHKINKGDRITFCMEKDYTVLKAVKNNGKTVKIVVTQPNDSTPVTLGPADVDYMTLNGN